MNQSRKPTPIKRAPNQTVAKGTDTADAGAERPRLRFAALLLGLVLAVLIPTLAVGVGAIWWAMAEQRSGAEGRLADTARAARLAVEQRFAAHIGALTAMAASPAFGSNPDAPDLLTLHQHATEVAERLGVRILVAQRDGTLLLVSGVPLGAPLPRAASPGMVEQVFATGRPAISNVAHSTIVNDEVVAAGVPVLRKDGTVALTVIAAFKTSRLYDLLKDVTIPEASFTAVIDANRVIVARSDDPGAAFRSIGQDSIDAMAGRQKGVFRSTSSNGVPRVYAFDNLPRAAGWTLVVAQDAAVFDAAWRRPALLFGAAGGIGLILAMVLVTVAARRILLPLHRLTAYAAAVAANSAERAAAASLPTFRVAEMEELRRGFVTAETSLRRHASELQAIFDASPIGYAHCMFTGKILDANDVCLSMLGVSRDELQSGAVSWADLTAPESQGVTERAIAEAFAAPGRRCAPYYKTFLRRDGIRVPVFNTLQVLDPDPVHGQAVVFLIDLTDVNRMHERLTESEAWLRGVLETAVEGIVVSDEQGMIVSANPAATGMFGYSSEAEMKGRPLHILMPDDEAERHDHHIALHITTGRARALGVTGRALNGRRRDGSVFPIEISVNSFQVNGKRFFTGVMRDVTERRQVEVMQARLAAIVAASPDAVISFSADDGHITSWNKGAETLFGWTADEAIGGPVNLLVPRSQPGGSGLLRRVLAGEIVKDLETVRVSKAGEEIPVAITSARKQGPDGTPLGVAVIFRDLRERRAAEAALRASEARLVAIGEASPDLIFSKDLDHRFIYANPATEALAGISASSIVGQRGIDFRADPAEAAAIHEHDRQVMETGQTGIFREELTGPDGIKRTFQVTKTPLRDPKTGAVIGLAGISRDITDQLASEEIRARLAAIVATTPDAVMSFAADGRITSWNHGAELLFGYSAQEALGGPPSLLVPDYLPDGDPTGVFHRAMAGTIVSGHETIRRTKAGDDIPVSVTAARMLGADGQTLGVSAIFHDLRATRAQEAALRRSETRWRTLTESHPGLVWEADPAGHVIFVNPAFQAYTGFPDSAPVAESWATIVHPDDSLRIATTWRAAVTSATVHEGELRLRGADGIYRWFIVRAVPQLEPDGAVERWIGACTDITDIVSAREAAARNAEDLERLVAERTRDLESTQARLAQASKMEALGRLAGGIAHDFNNVLQAVQSGLALALRRLDQDPGKVRSYLGLAVTAAERGTSVTSRLLAFAHRGELKAAPVHPSALMTSLLPTLVHTLGPTVSVRVACEPGVPPVLADKGQLETVLINLSNNARDALPDGFGTIVLSAALDQPPNLHGSGPFVRISVTDNGGGMDAEILARVSEPFFTTKPRGKGTGLGLAMARGFAEQSGGTLAIESATGHGTTVSIWLPVSREKPSSTTIDPGSERGPVASGIAILVVDDEPEVRHVLASLLEDMGHLVTEAENAASALALLDADLRADVMVTDLTMPGGLDGLGLVREARHRRPGLPVVLMTGHTGDAADSAMRHAERTGPFTVLRKPFATADLEKQVAALLRA